MKKKQSFESVIELLLLSNIYDKDNMIREVFLFHKKDGIL